MKVSGLKTEMTALFVEVHKRFEQVDKRFEQVDKRFEQVDKRFEQVDKRFLDLTNQIAEEGERTRRHFDVVAEQMKSERNLTLDQSMAATQRVEGLTASNAAAHAVYEKRLDDHERRIDTLEPGTPALPT